MLTSVHLLTGASIGKYFNNPWLIIGLAIISHYILDFIPHYSPSGFKEYKNGKLKNIPIKKILLLSIEPVLGITLLIYLIYFNIKTFENILLGTFFAWFPDLLCFISWKFLSPKYNINFFEKILPRPGNKLYNLNKSFLIGVFPQIIISIILITLL